ncbi:aminotransferase class I and II [Pendulispora rubella]|uniref:Aminotransferase class I and II n=1 Tax=Pendulispora rubella TaxID=2741070 RepID=A0ABZ2LK84_9BACT
MRTVNVIRYVLPFREGGSVPALVEADDLGLYVVKLRGAAQGTKPLVAELIAGELARVAGLRVPEIVLAELDRTLAASEPHREICDQLEASAGLNLALDYLPGSITFDPVVAPAPDAVTASRAVLLDAFVANVDRTPRNPNLLVWHTHLWLIDHGASLYFHHGWSPADPLDGVRDPFAEVRQHILLPWATELEAAAAHLAAAFTDGAIARIVEQIPAGWLGPEHGFSDDASHRAAYLGWLHARRATLPLLLEEAIRAQRV